MYQPCTCCQTLLDKGTKCLFLHIEIQPADFSMQLHPVCNNEGLLPQRGDRLRIRVPIRLPRPYLNRPRDLVECRSAPFVCWRECGEKTSMKKQGV